MVSNLNSVSNNRSCWRTKNVSTEDYYDGKWRWIIYDTDDSLGALEGYTEYDVDSFFAGHLSRTPMEASIVSRVRYGSEEVENAEEVYVEKVRVIKEFFKKRKPYILGHLEKNLEVNISNYTK